MLSCRNFIFVDECGTPSFIDAGTSFKDRGYVMAATVVPALQRGDLLDLIPRGADGSLLKASSREMTPAIAADFIKRVLSSPIDLALVMLDTGTKQNEAIASQAAEIAGQTRLIQGAPPIKRGPLMYLLMVNAAIVNAWGHSAIRRGEEMKCFEVVMDSYSIKVYDKNLLEKELRNAMVRQSVCVNSIRWESEEQEPLLNIPDLFAGICRRQLTHRDAGEAWTVIKAAIDSGRIGLQDGMRLPLRNSAEQKLEPELK